MLGDLEKAAIEEIPKFISSIILLILVWKFGQALNVKWSIRQKRREYNLEAAREFNALYGEFFAVWKLWHYLLDDENQATSSYAARWELLKRACSAEGRIEALLLSLSSERPLGTSETEKLGRYRQIYQRLRESIRDGVRIPFAYSEQPEYIAFKELAPEIAAMIVSEDSTGVSTTEAASAFKEITSNRWEGRKVARGVLTRVAADTAAPSQ